MPTLVTDTIKQQNDAKFPVAESNDVKGGPFSKQSIAERDAIPKGFLTQGCQCYVVDETVTYRYEGDKWVPFGVMETAVPELTYDFANPAGKKLYYKVGEQMTIVCKFTSTTYGDCTIRVYKDNVLFKTITSPKGTIALDLGKADSEGTFSFRIAGQDYLGIVAPDDLTYTVVVGGLTLTSTFGQVIASTIETSTNIIAAYSVKSSDSSSQVKVKFNLLQGGAEVKTDVIDTGTYESNGQWTIGMLERGLYTLTMQAYTGVSLEDQTEGALVSSKLTFQFTVLSEGEIAIIAELDATGITDDTPVSIPFRCSAKGISKLLMKGTVSRVVIKDGVETLEDAAVTPAAGISCTSDITTYWFIGKLPVGKYRYNLKAYTLDSQKVSKDPAIGDFDVAESTYEKLDPVSANMIAWFDANDMRNNSENPDIWVNKAATGSRYNIKLHNLNFNTNGWKHVDESLDDSVNGEMMLKFTGDSYAEMIDTQAKAQYCPLGMMTNAAEGYTLEVVFRTRNIGEMNARVMTCQNKTDTGTPGFSVTPDSLWIASDSQSTSLGFAAEQWVHAAFVIDKNVRSLDAVGLSNIENMNPIPMMHIYINGVLCSSTALTTDKFLDANGNAYPLLLNAAYNMNGDISNFGECEIKMIRMYGTYLKSSDILQNYISAVYDTALQKALNTKNDTSVASMKVITFKRRKTSTNKTTFSILNSITEKKVSKKTCVDCIIEVDNGNGDIEVWDSVDVYLQGTSSLQYPVKNYKLKLFEDIGKSKKKKVKMKDNWQPENTFTLKCDYMEESHLNNTPTANFYNELMSQLGADSPAAKQGYLDAIDGFPVIVYYTDDPDDPKALTYAGSFMFNIDKSGNTIGFGAEVRDENGNKFRDHLGNEIPNKCQSFEGVANSTDSAGCFYRLEDSINNIYKYYVEDCYEEAYNKYIKDHALNPDSFTMEDFKKTPEYSAVKYKTFEEFVAEYDELDYIATDFEARYDYTGYDDMDDPTQEDKERCYGPIRDLVNWVSDASKDLNRFKAEFNDHFNYKYCLGYYLQMMVFGQVDNAGKNSMWDTWDGKIWMPRPYDMDTQVGLSNTGTETINPDAELNPVMAPTSATGTFADYTSNSVTELRYASYNTKTSRFWNSFGVAYKNEIASAYQNLRKTVYDLDFIMKFYKERTVDIIGEIYYNKDSAAKYFTQTNADNTEYLKMLHGNRIQRFQQWMEQRIIFCDTMFGYRYSEDNTNSLNSEITLRSDAYLNSGSSGGDGSEGSTLKAYIGIASYTPQYVTVNVGSSLDAVITAYVGPDSTYTDPDSKQVMQGTLFTIPIKATDKEITISGAGNIMYINKIEDLNIRDLTIANATKILSLNLAGSSRMTRLIMGQNKYLRELNCAGSYLLGTASGGQVLDLTGCKNIQKVDISNTQITTINFAQGGNLKRANLTSSLVKNLSFKSLEFLTEVIITDCTNLTEYIIESCPMVESLSVSGAPIATFKAVDCANLKSVDCSSCKALENFEITGCDNIEILNMKDNTGKMMNDLSLYTLYKLKELNVGNSSTLRNIRFPRYESKEEADRIAEAKLSKPNATDEELKAKLWHNLRKLTISYSGIKWIQYGSDDISEAARSLDMGQLTLLDSVSFRSCTNVTDIANLSYTARDASALFRDCTELRSIQGTLRVTSNASSIFYNCKKLTNLSALTTNFAGVTTISNAFAYCTDMSYETAKQVIQTCDGSLLDMSSLFAVKGSTPNGGGNLIPDDMFSTVPNVTNINYLFDVNYTLTSLTSTPFRGLNKVTTAQGAFSRCTGLTRVDQDFLTCFPKLTNAYAMFARDTALVNFIDGNCNIFASCPNITTIQEMFAFDSKLKNSAGLTDMLKPLTKLTNAKYTFYGCSAFTGSIPNGFFATNTLLTDITGCFAGCTGITGLPDRLFRKTDSDTNTLSALRLARSVFANCTKLAGTIKSNFFAGAPNITDIGYSNQDSQYMSNTKYTIYGFFANTLISGYYDDFLSRVPNLQSCYGLFNHENNNPTALKYCYYWQDEAGQQVAKEHDNTVSMNLLAKNKQLTDVRKMFRSCTAIKGCVPYELSDGTPASFFNASKNSLLYADEVFYGCTGLTGIDLEKSEIIGIKKELFAGFAKLRQLNSFFYGCSNYSMDFPEGLFDGCVSLQLTYNMFYGCVSLQGTIPVTLFNSCRKTLLRVDSMFNGCTGLTGTLPKGIKGEGGTIVQKGFLADCINLQNASALFYRCTALTGGIPDDMFYTSSISDKYNQLTNISNIFGYCQSLDEPYVDEVTGVKYLCSPEFFVKCVALTTVEHAFGRLLAMPACQLPMTLFAKQVALQSAKNCFYGVRQLTGSITATFMINCMNTLQQAYGLFAFCNITNIDAGFLHGELKNSKLKTVGAMFYSNTNLAGNCPQFWDGSIFTAIQGDEAGYYGCLYQCTKVANYAAANAVSANWSKNVNIYV